MILRRLKPLVAYLAPFVRNLLALGLLLVTVTVLVSSCARFQALSSGAGVESEVQEGGENLKLEWWKNEKLDRAREEWERQKGKIDRPDINSEDDL